MCFLTNNAGDDIPGSTIKWTIKTYGHYFDSILVVDGRITKEAKEYYEQNNICYIDSPWTGRHVDQYKKRNEAIPIGDWILALDCDEAPSAKLCNFIKENLGMAEERGITMLALPVESWWCKEDSNMYYKAEVFEDRPDYFRKFILYKNLPDTILLSGEQGTHVSIRQKTGHTASLPFTYDHFKSPETIIFNAAVTMMEDLLSDPRGLTPEEHRKLYAIGQKYDILTGAKFRKITKQHAWPTELVDFVKTLRRKNSFCKALYLLYFVIEKAAVDESNPNPTYEDACKAYGYNLTYGNSQKHGIFLNIPHTPSLLKNPDLPVGAG